MRLWLALILSGSAVISAQAPPRNVILFLADAAGIATINAASLHGYGEARQLFVQRMPSIALSETSTASQFVTDSAAGMTAIVTGERTHNGVIAQSAKAVRGKSDGAPLKTILEYAEEHGLSTGLISNDSVAGATPATLYAKSNERGRTAEIFVQAFAPRFGDGVDVMIGSGRPTIAAALKQSGRDLETLTQVHRRTIYASLADVPSDATRPIVLLDDDEFDLEAAIEIARRVLSRNPRGYFLMVESDTHTDSIRHGLDRLVTFDRVIARTAARVDANTLLLFTADHSFDLRVHSGLKGKPLLNGVSAELGSGAEAVRLRNVRMDDSHTGEEVLVAAAGPGSERIRGYMANTDLFHVMMATFGWSAANTH